MIESVLNTLERYETSVEGLGTDHLYFQPVCTCGWSSACYDTYANAWNTATNHMQSHVYQKAWWR